MDGPTARMLFEALREDIRSLKRDVADVLTRHEKEIEELRELRWRWAGAMTAIMVIFEIGVKLIGHAVK